MSAWATKQRLLLYASVVVYAAVAYYLSALRFMEFYCRNWDFGIFQQALWSTAHGRVMWESGDLETFGVTSFFQIHPSFIMFPLAGLYEISPVPWTLLLLQAVVTGLAAIPLYCLAKRVTGSETKGLIAAVVFLAWTPVLSSNLYDFHLESFLPLELFTFFYLWVSRQYWFALAAAAVSSLTLEIVPILIVFFLFFVYFDDILDFARAFWSWVRGKTGNFLRSFTAERASREKASGREDNPVLSWGIAMLVFSIAIYLLLRLFQGPLLSLVLGTTSSASPGANLSPTSLNLSIYYFPGGFLAKAEYWVLIYALVAFIPLLYPRTVILVAPWVFWTFFTPYLNTVHLGYSYGYIAAVPMLIGFCYGLSRFDSASFRWIGSAPRSPTGEARGRKRLPSPLATVIVVVLVANILISPVDPLVQSSGLAGFGTPGYWVSYDQGPGYSQVVSAAALIDPSSSYVLASDDLFVFVANDVNAYSTLTNSQNLSNTPFSPSNLPTYLFISGNEAAYLPQFISNVLVGTSDYGVRAIVNSTPVGTVTLYELGYHPAGPESTEAS